MRKLPRKRIGLATPSARDIDRKFSERRSLAYCPGLAFLRHLQQSLSCLPVSNGVCLEPEDVWLRFFLPRMRLDLRNAKSPDTLAILKELISDAEERLDRLERGTDNGHTAG